jgi:hypothetical protein
MRSDAVRYGRNRDKGTWDDSRYTRCAFCRFIGHMDRNSWEDNNVSSTSMVHPYTQLNGAVLAGAASVTVDSTSGFSSSGYIYIYDTGLANSSTASRCNKVTYTGKTGTTFTGCSNVTAHSDNMYVRGEQTPSGGCPKCGHSVRSHL